MERYDPPRLLVFFCGSAVAAWMSSSSSLSSSTANPEDAALNQLLSNSQFFCLCLLVLACYYVALCLSARALGESTCSFATPFNFLRHISADLGATIAHAVSRHRGGHGGADFSEDGYGGFMADNVYDTSDGFNSPAVGLR